MARLKVHFVLWTVVATLACSAIDVQAANWYVDNAATGSNNGTSWANAWTAFSSIVWGSSGVKAGDTLNISGGSASKTYSATLTAGASGSSGNPIIIRIGQDAEHSGRAVLTGLNLYQREYITVDGENSGSNHIDISGNIEASESNHFILRYLDVHGSAFGLIARYGTGGTVSHCNFYNIGTTSGDSAGISFNARNLSVPGYDQTIVEYTTINVNRQAGGSGTGPDGIQGCWGLTVKYCSLKNTIGTAEGTQHQDFIQVMAQYVTIRGNTFIGSADSAIDYDRFNGNPHHHLIYNNVFILIRGSGIRYYSSSGSFTSMTDVHIYNNAFVDHISGHQWALSVTYIVGGALSLSNVAIKNNIFYNCINPVRIEASSSASQADWNFDYNLINAGASGNTAVTIDGNSYAQANPVTAAPSFVRYTQGSESSDLRLSSSDTAAKDHGTDLSAYFTTDKDGLTRPIGSAWDIGAYETGIGAPSRLRVHTVQ